MPKIRISFKRKRNTRRSFRRNYGRKKIGRRLTAFTANKGAFNPTPFRSRRISKSSWRRSLINSTRHQNHWRSNSSTAFNFATATTQGVGTVNTITPFIPSTGNPFWTEPGGLLTTDQSVDTVIFSGDLTLRGGKIGLTLLRDVTSSDHVQVQVWVVWLIPNPETGIIPASTPMGWDPSMVPDLARSFGRVVGYRTVNLGTTTEDFTMEYRLRPYKIDQHTTGVLNGSQPIFMIKATNLTDNTDVVMRGIFYHNVSFAGDASLQPPEPPEEP